MKRKLFFAATAATLLFTGCANDEYVGEVENPRGELTEITFASKNAGITRANSEGSAAANMLNKQFFVYGTKNVNSTDQVVFKNYMVRYFADSKSATNSSGWEYNGIAKENNPTGSGSETFEWPTDGVTPNIFVNNSTGTNVDAQTPKYWDYSASSYTYYAFSALPADLEKSGETEPNIKVNKIETPSDGNEYEVTLKSIANIQHLYFADKNTIEKPSSEQGTLPSNEVNTYTGNVKLTFRPLTAKVRVGFYETIPGYSVQIKNMSTSNSTQTTGEGASATTTAWDGKFIAECPNLMPDNSQTIKVSYLDENNNNRANATVWENSQAKSTNDNLTLGNNIKDKDLGKTSKNVTWDTANGDYTFVWPQPSNSKPLKITVDYTLTSTDGSNETINVKGATAEVPAEYVQWMSGVAYTYLFKITDHTNGTTGGTTDPAGLYPIVFDAVVAEEDMGSVTTVSALSITAKQDITTGGQYVAADGIVFQTGQEIKLKVMQGDDEVSGASIKAGWVTIYDYTKTPEQNCNSLTDVSNGTLDAQSENGYWVIKVSKDSATSYLVLKVGQADDK